MSKILETYDQNWQTRYTLVRAKLDHLYASKRDENGALNWEEVRRNPFFRMRQKELHDEELAAEMAQFKTIEDCIAYHEAFLQDEVTELMSEYIVQQGNIRDERDRFCDRFSRVIRGQSEFARTAIHMPHAIADLARIHKTDQIETPQDVLKQFGKQFASLEPDFIAAMKAVTVEDTPHIHPLPTAKPPKI